MQDEHPGLLRTVGRAAGEFTGLPSLWRAARDTGTAYNNLEAGAGHEALRHGLGALGNAAYGVGGLSTVLLPGLGKALGPLRLAAWMRNRGGLTAARQLTEFPSFGKTLYNSTYRNVVDPGGVVRRTAATAGDRGAMLADAAATRTRLFPTSGTAARGVVDRARDIKFRTNPNLFDYNHPTTNSSLVRNYFSAPAKPPVTLPEHVANLPRFVGNRAINAGYGLHQLARRHPQTSLFALGLPTAGMGVVRDDAERRRQDLTFGADPSHNKGPFAMPISTGVSGLLNLVGSGNANSGLLSQLRTN